nr:MAG TPA: hypothetical protein [Caudoviricetes sp.]
MVVIIEYLLQLLCKSLYINVKGRDLSPPFYASYVIVYFFLILISLLIY